jgi:hypothetical protein
VNQSRFLPVLVFIAAFLAAHFGSGSLPPPVAIATSLDASVRAEPGPLTSKASSNVAMQGHPAGVSAASASDKGTAILRPAVHQAPAPAVFASRPASGGLAAALAARLARATTPAELLRDADLSDPEVRALVVARMSELQDEQHEAALAKADRLGIPVRIEGPGRKVSVLYDFRGDKPLYRVTLNVNAAISTGANLLRDQSTPYGLDGTGMKVGVWDEATSTIVQEERFVA